jgi:hypothetical protein
VIDASVALKWFFQNRDNKDTPEKLPAWLNSRIDELLPLSPEAIKALIQK